MELNLSIQKIKRFMQGLMNADKVDVVITSVYIRLFNLALMQLRSNFIEVFWIKTLE